VNRYLQSGLHFEFSTMSELHERFYDHSDFKKVLPGDMFVYSEKNLDSWSGYYGSKPDLKLHIKRVFNDFRATEALMFTVRTEVERLKATTKIAPSERARQQSFDKKVEIITRVIEQQQKELDAVRKEISILLHHDSITGTSSPTAEQDWMQLIFRSDLNLKKLQYELTEKLGRLQSMNQRVDVGFVGFRATPVETPVQGRGAM
jgi:hypothetical protein